MKHVTQKQAGPISACQSPTLDKARGLTLTGYSIVADRTAIALAFSDPNKVGSQRIIVNLYAAKEITID
jgi:hypothetical protein